MRCRYLARVIDDPAQDTGSFLPNYRASLASSCEFYSPILLFSPTTPTPILLSLLRDIPKTRRKDNSFRNKIKRSDDRSFIVCNFDSYFPKGLSFIRH